MGNSIGTVIAVNPGRIQIEVPDNENISYNENGYSYFYDGINSYLTIQGVDRIKKVYQVVDMYQRDLNTYQGDASKIKERYVFEAEPLGELTGDEFSFGINSYPLLGDLVRLATEYEMKSILDDNNETITIGKLVQKNLYPRVSVDTLFGSHCCVLGNTGSGKSTTVKTILRQVLSKVENGLYDPKKINTIVFDIHNEYFTDRPKNVERIDIMNEISIDIKRLSKEDWINLVDPSTQVQLPVLLKALKLGNLIDQRTEMSWIKAYIALELYNNVPTDANAKKVKVQSLLNSLGDDKLTEAANFFGDYGNVLNIKRSEFDKIIKEYVEQESGTSYDSVVNDLDSYLTNAKYSIESLESLGMAIELVFLFEEMKGNNQIRSYCSTLVTRVETLKYNYDTNLFSTDANKRERFESIFDNRYAITVLDVSKFDNLDLKFISTYLLTYIMDKQVQKSINDRDIYNIVMDEAHRYMNEKANNGLPIIYDRVAKEGRKYGVFLMIASQRPSELSGSVISQCNNFFIHRIRNNVDLEFIRKSIPFITDSSMKRVSFLQTGVSLCLGDSFAIPFELAITKSVEEPLTKVTDPSNSWIRE